LRIVCGEEFLTDRKYCRNLSMACFIARASRTSVHTSIDACTGHHELVASPFLDERDFLGVAIS
jgi:hypothetical protein